MENNRSNIDNMEEQVYPMDRYGAERIAVKIAKALNEAEIPCVLWGDSSICLWGTEILKRVSPRTCREARSINVLLTDYRLCGCRRHGRQGHSDTTQHPALSSSRVPMRNPCEMRRTKQRQ